MIPRELIGHSAIRRPDLGTYLVSRPKSRLALVIIPTWCNIQLFYFIRMRKEQSTFQDSMRALFVSSLIILEWLISSVKLHRENPTEACLIFISYSNALEPSYDHPHSWPVLCVWHQYWIILLASLYPHRRYYQVSWLRCCCGTSGRSETFVYQIHHLKGWCQYNL